MEGEQSPHGAPLECADKKGLASVQACMQDSSLRFSFCMTTADDDCSRSFSVPD